MKNLKIWQKLALLAAVFMLPFLIVTANLLTVVEEQVDFARELPAPAGLITHA